MVLAMVGLVPGWAAAQLAPNPAPSPTWIPRGLADLTVLDKVSAKVTPLSVKVGESGTYGPLTIGVRGCYVRPPDLPADSTAFLDVVDATAGATAFHAWLIASVPAASGMQNPVYDVRLVTCR